MQSTGRLSQASGGWAREDEEDGGKALNARQEEDGRQKPIRQPGSRVPSFSQLFRPLEDQDTARNACEKKIYSTSWFKRSTDFACSTIPLGRGHGSRRFLYSESSGVRRCARGRSQLRVLRSRETEPLAKNAGEASSSIFSQIVFAIVPVFRASLAIALAGELAGD